MGDVKKENDANSTSVKQQIYNELYNFSLGVVAGISGAVVVYPIGRDIQKF